MRVGTEHLTPITLSEGIRNEAKHSSFRRNEAKRNKDTDYFIRRNEAKRDKDTDYFILGIRNEATMTEGMKQKGKKQ